MKQQHFEDIYSAQWQTFEKLLELQNDSDPNFAKNYRAVCHHYAIAKKRRYSAHLIEKLNQLVIKGHQKFYRQSSFSRFLIFNFFLTDFPHMLREQRIYILISSMLFLLPGIITFIACLYGENFIYSLMPTDSVKEMESMYDPALRTGLGERGSESDLVMFGYYIKNNIGIAFRTFAGGILFGLGSVFFLVFNGLMIGGVAGHLTQLQFTSTFYSFVIGHGAFELTAIVFSGAAGLKIGFALIAPGNDSRSDALRLAAKKAATIMIGSAFMLVIAAFIEAFWSSSQTISLSIKYSVGAFLWLIVLLYCILLGKSREFR